MTPHPAQDAENKKALEDAKYLLKTVIDNFQVDACEPKKGRFKVIRHGDNWTYVELKKPDGKDYTSFHYWLTEEAAHKAAELEYRSAWEKIEQAPQGDARLYFLRSVLSKLDSITTPAPQSEKMDVLGEVSDGSFNGLFARIANKRFPKNPSGNYVCILSPEEMKIIELRMQTEPRSEDVSCAMEQIERNGNGLIYADAPYVRTLVKALSILTKESPNNEQ